MKQRKPPYVLGGILVVALCVVVAIGFTFAKQAGGEMEAPPPPPDVEATQPHGTPSPSVVSSAVTKASGKGAAPEAKAPMGVDGKSGGPSARPSVQLPRRDPVKPKPDGSTTSSQWW